MFSCLVVDEMRKGNSSKGTMTRRGYDNLRDLYEQQTGLKHDLRCMKNRFSQLKTMYSYTSGHNYKQVLATKKTEG